MNSSILEKKCGRHNLKLKWICVYTKCNEPLFCIKCRKMHTKSHESYLYPLKEIIEDDEDNMMESEIIDDTKIDLKKKIKLEIQDICLTIKKQLESNIEKISESLLFNHKENSVENNLKKMRMKFKKNTSDVGLLLNIGQKYHRYIQESKNNSFDQIESNSNLENKLKTRFDRFISGVNGLLKNLIKGTNKSSSQLKEYSSIEDNIINEKAVPDKWKQPPQENLIEKSLISVKANNVPYVEVESVHSENIT